MAGLSAGTCMQAFNFQEQKRIASGDLGQHSTFLLIPTWSVSASLLLTESKALLKVHEGCALLTSIQKAMPHLWQTLLF